MDQLQHPAMAQQFNEFTGLYMETVPGGLTRNWSDLRIEHIHMHSLCRWRYKYVPGLQENRIMMHTLYNVQIVCGLFSSYYFTMIAVMFWLTIIIHHIVESYLRTWWLQITLSLSRAPSLLHHVCFIASQASIDFVSSYCNIVHPVSSAYTLQGKW